MNKAINLPRIGFSLGLLLFIASFGGGLFCFEVLRDTSLLDTPKEDWMIISFMWGLPFCALFVLVGTSLILTTMKAALTSDRRRTLGWFIFGGGIIFAIYLLQYFFTGFGRWSALDTGIANEWSTESVVPLALFIFYILAIILTAVIITVGLLVAHMKKEPQAQPLPSREAIVQYGIARNRSLAFGFALTAIVLGVLSLFHGFNALYFIVVSLLGIAFGAFTLKRLKTYPTQVPLWMAISALVCAIVALVGPYIWNIHFHYNQLGEPPIIY